MQNKFKLYFISKKADIYIEDRDRISPASLIFAWHEGGDKFWDTNDESFFLFYLTEGEQVEISDIDYIEDQQAIDMLAMLHPGYGFENLTITQINDFRALHNKWYT